MHCGPDDSTPDGDIEIRYIGLRPAEKLVEELLIESNVSGTRHPRIVRAEEDYIPFDKLTQMIDEEQSEHRHREERSERRHREERSDVAISYG